MPDVLVDQADDRLAVRLDLLGARVQVAYPVERLLRRRDVVAHRRKHDDRLADRLQVEIAAGPEPRLALRELVADEEIVDDPADLFLVHQVEAAPPALEFEEALRFVVDVVEEVVVLLPQRVRRVEALEVLHEMRAVELAAAEIAREQRYPRAADQSPRVAHRVVAVVARPVRHRRAVDDQRPRDVGTRRREHHHRPAALTVADEHGLRALRMALGDDAHELRLGVGDVGERLAGLGVRIENDEVHGMAGLQRHADLRVFLEAADARAVPGARVDDDVGPQLVVDLDAAWRHDAHERVIDRALERAPVGQNFVFVREDRRLAGFLVLEEVVAALAQRVPEQRRTLREIDRVFPGIVPRLLRLHAAPGHAGGNVRGLRAAYPVGMRRNGVANTALEYGRDTTGDGDRSVDRLVQAGHGGLSRIAAMQHRTRGKGLPRCNRWLGAAAEGPAVLRRKETRAARCCPRHGLAAKRRFETRGVYARWRRRRIASSCASAAASSASACAISSFDVLFCIASSAARFASSAAFSSRSFARIAVSASTVTRCGWTSR